MKIEMTKEDYDVIYNYVIYKMNSPCSDCKDRPTCCGCPKQREYDEKHKNIYDKYKATYKKDTVGEYLAEDIQFKISNIIGMKDAYEKIFTSYINTIQKLKDENEDLFEYLHTNHKLF